MNPTHVECSICLETYKPPIRMTNCGHSFCEGCIMPAYPKPGWRCPLCNTIHNHSAATLARNYLAEEIVASFQVQPSAPPPSALTTSGGEFGMCNWHQQNITIYCTAHSQDQCFQCADEKVCGGVKRSDCKTETKVAIKNLIGRETKIVQDHANDIISKIENQTAILINKFMDEETKAKTRIRDTEKDLLEKIKQNPHKWSSNSLKFKMTTETSLTPSVGVEILKNSQISEISGESVMRNSSNQNLQNEKTSDHKFTGPFHSDGLSLETLGKIRIYKNFKLSLEWKMKSHEEVGFLLIGDWFGFSLRKADNGTGYIFRLYQKNGLYNFYNDTNKEPFQIEMGQWHKEF